MFSAHWPVALGKQMVYYAPKAPGWPGAEDYSWRNAAAHLGMGADPLVRRPERLLAYVPDLAELLTLPQDREAVDLIRRHERTGRPLGDEVFRNAWSGGCIRGWRRGRPAASRKTGGNKEGNVVVTDIGIVSPG